MVLALPRLRRHGIHGVATTKVHKKGGSLRGKKTERRECETKYLTQVILGLSNAQNRKSGRKREREGREEISRKQRVMIPVVRKDDDNPALNGITQTYTRKALPG